MVFKDPWIRLEAELEKNQSWAPFTEKHIDAIKRDIGFDEAMCRLEDNDVNFKRRCLEYDRYNKMMDLAVDEVFQSFNKKIGKEFCDAILDDDVFKIIDDLEGDDGYGTRYRDLSIKNLITIFMLRRDYGIPVADTIRAFEYIKIQMSDDILPTLIWPLVKADYTDEEKDIIKSAEGWQFSRLMSWLTSVKTFDYTKMPEIIDAINKHSSVEETGRLFKGFKLRKYGINRKQLYEFFIDCIEDKDAYSAKFFRLMKEIEKDPDKDLSKDTFTIEWLKQPLPMALEDAADSFDRTVTDWRDKEDKIIGEIHTVAPAFSEYVLTVMASVVHGDYYQQQAPSNKTIRSWMEALSSLADSLKEWSKDGHDVDMPVKAPYGVVEPCGVSDLWKAGYRCKANDLIKLLDAIGKDRMAYERFVCLALLYMGCRLSEACYYRNDYIYYMERTGRLSSKQQRKLANSVTITKTDDNPYPFYAILLFLSEAYTVFDSGPRKSDHDNDVKPVKTSPFQWICDGNLYKKDNYHPFYDNMQAYDVCKLMLGGAIADSVTLERTVHPGLENPNPETLESVMKRQAVETGEDEADDEEDFNPFI